MKKAGTKLKAMSLSSFLIFNLLKSRIEKQMMMMMMMIPTAGISPNFLSEEFLMSSILLPYYSPECYTEHLQRDVILIEWLKQPMLSCEIASSESKNQSRRIYGYEWIKSHEASTAPAMLDANVLGVFGMFFCSIVTMKLFWSCGCDRWVWIWFSWKPRK